MSQIAPDIPELQDVPEPIRGVMWTRAQMYAIRSPVTRLIGFVSASVGAALAVGLGAWLAGPIGALIGMPLGISAGVYFCLRVVMEWRTRRVLPDVLRAVDWRTEFADLIEAHERIQRVARTARGSDRES
jgi:hypothetical protein